ncbi:formate/nitrite transporter [Orenia metallireducens]|jgi:formate/nitrite transporter|uniref:Formate/nitrite transporter n=1 Tax=Orenia metallireducens TaxID=1413210 RepID=A0A285HD07_9FIRM|nr:formate/nitrite transporter family protein [Orenia metallireducens]PRX27720.1 formate/nitrite transporter [Orenia metallireducens]SNY33618.1 formate/nitrite transporter [Orenia metallireducens]
MEKRYLKPQETIDYTIESGIKKTHRSNSIILLSAIIAGIFIAMGALSSNTAAYTIKNSGAAKIVTGAIFPVGLMLIIIVGADLFTSNCLLMIGTLEKRIKWGSFLRVLGIVYIGNFIGTVLIAIMTISAGQFDAGNGALGAYHIHLALHKLEASFGQAIILGTLCNIIVCAAALAMYSAQDITSKVWGGFFPIFAFIIAGFQHSIANMYYIPAGIIASKNPLYLEAGHFTQNELAMLTWRHFFIDNLLPVTIGNIIGGAVVIGASYWYIFVYQKNSTAVKKSKHIAA